MFMQISTEAIWSSPWYRWPIEIDGLPIKNGDFPWRTVSHNQMVPSSPQSSWPFFLFSIPKTDRNSLVFAAGYQLAGKPLPLRWKPQEVWSPWTWARGSFGALDSSTWKSIGNFQSKLKASEMLQHVATWYLKSELDGLVFVQYLNAHFRNN